jgi:hypothetical protein
MNYCKNLFTEDGLEDYRLLNTGTNVQLYLYVNLFHLMVYLLQVLSESLYNQRKTVHMKFDEDW